MDKKMLGSRYPYCNSHNRRFKKSQAHDGEILIEEGNLIFRTKALFGIRAEGLDLCLPLNEIEKVETMNLNGIMPFGVCIFMEDGSEHMLGAANNKKLKNFILVAKGDMPGYESVSKDNNKNNLMIIGVAALIIAIIVGLGIMSIRESEQKSIVEDEIVKIDDIDIYKGETIDMKIKATGKYGILEKTIKEYYEEIFKYKMIYSENSSVKIFNELSLEYLQNNRLSKLQEKLDSIDSREKKATDAINKIITMLDEDYTMERIEKQKLGKKYNDYYRELIIFEEDDETIQEWKDEIAINSEKKEYLKELIKILIDYDDSWYIEDDTLYISDDYALKRYNELYDKILDED